MRVLLIAGGWSTERDVSLSGAKAVGTALTNLGHEVLPLDPSRDFAGLLDAARDADFAYIALHGSPGEDGLIQAMLETVGCPYQGAGPAGSFLALNKAASKAIFEREKLQSANWEFLTEPPEAGWQPKTGYPLFAKPNLGGSSPGMSKVLNESELAPALETIFGMGEEALLEEYIEGVELTCAVLGDEALPLVLIRPKVGDFFTYESKYQAGKAEEICPAPVDEALTRRIQKTSLAAHKALGLTGYSRADFIVDADGEPWLLEVNTLPGMTPTSRLPQEAAAVGLSFEDLIERLLELGIAQAKAEG